MQHKNPETMEKIKNFVLTYYRENNRMPTIRTIAESVGLSRAGAYKYLVEMGKRGMIEYDGGIISVHSARASTKIKATYNAGILGSIACGIPDNVTEIVKDYIPLPTCIFGEGELYILRAQGDSMIEAGIDEGDLVVIRKADRANDGDIVVALVDNQETTLKRMFVDHDQHLVILHPENPDMEDIVVPTCQIQGVAVSVIKSFEASKQ